MCKIRHDYRQIEIHIIMKNLSNHADQKDLEGSRFLIKIITKKMAEMLFVFNPIDPDPAIEAHVVFSQSGHSRTGKKVVFPYFCTFFPK